MNRVCGKALFAVCAFAVGSAGAAGPDTPLQPADLIPLVQSVSLGPGVTVPSGGVEFQQGPARFQLRTGTLFPATPLAGISREVVFVGSGVLTLQPPDEIEAGQLELFTGSRTVDASFQSAVFLVPAGETARVLSTGAPAGGEAADRAADLWTKWKSGSLRKLVGAEGVILSDLLGDPAAASTFAAWVQSEDLKDFLYQIDPEADEPVTLGRFVPLETTKSEAKRIRRVIEREQWRDHLVGLSLEDLGQFDTWMSACPRGGDGQPVHGHASVEPERYTIDLRIAKLVDSVTGSATLRLRVVDPGRRAVTLRLGGDLRVDEVRDGADRALRWMRYGSEILVLLAEPTRAGEPLGLTVHFSGNPFQEADYTTFALRSPISWHPHAGTLDSATYDVTLHWPKKYQVVASGARAGGGEEKDGYLWERRTIEHPVDAATFEIGLYTLRQVQAGHVAVTLAFDRDMKDITARQDRIAETVSSAIGYFEELFGPYPADDLKVVTVPRGYSQGLSGFVTLSDVMMVAGSEDERTVVAHEIAHQWWGNVVGQRSYHDAWLSEGMANYAALLYQKHRVPEKDRVRVGPTTRWKLELEGVTEEGRPVESIGPLILGNRLDSSKCDSAYEAIVYVKGALVLDMLAKLLGEDKFLPILKDVAARYAGRSLSTEEFLQDVGKKTFEKLDWFSAQYITGTGIPDIHYTWTAEQKGPGRWTVTGKLDALPPFRYRYRVVRQGAGFDLVREAVQQTSVADWDLVIPFQIMIHLDKGPEAAPAAKARPGKENEDPSRKVNMQQNGRLVMHEPTKPFSIDTEYEPLDFLLDRNGEVLARFFSEKKNPRRLARLNAERLAASGRTEEAAAAYRKILEMPAEEDSERKDKSVDMETLAVHLALARLALDRRQFDEARAEMAVTRDKGDAWQDLFTQLDLLLIEARLDLLEGHPDEAYKRLEHMVRYRRWGGTELQGLRAISARLTAHEDEAKDALEVARRRGVDVSALEAAP